jgi:hypothetical protein
MSDNPNQIADEAFSISHDSDDENVSSSDEQQVEQQQPVEQPVEATEAEQAEQPVEAVEPAPEPSEPDENAEPSDADAGKQHMVPVKELQKERQKRQDEARLREIAEANAKQYQELVERISTQQTSQQPPQPVQQPDLPDPYEDPEGYTNAVVEQRMGALQHSMMNMQLNMSEQLAVSQHGQDVVNAAYEAVKAAGNAQQFIQSPDAYGAMVKWHREQQAIAEFGSDPAAYKETLRNELREELLAELKAGGAQLTGQPAPQQQAQPQRLPGTLSDAPAQGVQGRQMTQQALADDIYSSERDRRL